MTALRKRLAASEQALRDAEARCRDLHVSARFGPFAEASPVALWIRDAASLEMDYASPATARIFGVAPDTLLGDVKAWAALIVPEDRGLALQGLERARSGDVVQEFRIQRPSDRAFRWIRTIGFPLRDDAGRVQRIGGFFEDVTEAWLADRQRGVLVAELRHRVRNIMAVIRAVAARTADSAATVRDYAEAVAGRLLTLARIQAMLARATQGGIGIGAMLRDELRAQAQPEARFDIAGPEVVLSPKAAEVLTLALHELVTNAARHGALATEAGQVRIRWSVRRKRGAPWLGFDWTETGRPRHADAAPPRKGFGTELIERRIPYELGGRGSVVLGSGGAHCHIEFPLTDGVSILETDAPRPATVFGGVLDMAGEPDLTGHRILVVEDDFYLATDTARAIRGAGAEVIGPCAKTETALRELAASEPTGAIVDIGLDAGPSFAVARRLRDRGIPFIFVSGYDDGAIPTEFEEVRRLQKPVELRRAVTLLAQALRG